uniref:INCENP_ARK-bind domain-containing protein n=1 Tax=Elaeophora elaphi TaxID=1147741 RepID=A0A0R3S4W3_9BILA
METASAESSLTAQMNELQCASDAYQYISQIIENALEQTEQILLKLKTQRDDTIINVKNKRVRLSETNAEKNKPSAVHMQNGFGYNAERISAIWQHPRKISGASWKVTDLLRFPVDDEEMNLRFSDRIFTSLDRKSIMLMREYDSFPNHAHQQQRTKSSDWYRKQSKATDLQQRHIESDQRRVVSCHYQQTDLRQPSEEFHQQEATFHDNFGDVTHRQSNLRQKQLNQRQQFMGHASLHQQQMKKNSMHRLISNQLQSKQFQRSQQQPLQMQEPEVKEFTDKEASMLALRTDPSSTKYEFKSISNDDSYAESFAVRLSQSEGKVPEKLQKQKPHGERKKSDNSESKPYPEKKPYISSIHHARRSASDTSLHCKSLPIVDHPDILSGNNLALKLLKNPKIKHKTKEKKKKVMSNLERELSTELSPPKEDEMSDRRDEKPYESEKRRKRRKNKNQQSAEQHFPTSSTPKQSRLSMIDPVGRRKVKKSFKRIFSFKLRKNCNERVEAAFQNCNERMYLFHDT